MKKTLSQSKEKPNNMKTVYVLGAGFSAPAGGPDQSKLIEAILKLPETQSKVKNAKKALRSFLQTVMMIAPSGASKVTLEDIYTPIDRCLADGQALRGKSTDDLRVLRGQMEYLISLAIDRSFDLKAKKQPQAAAYVQEFADFLVQLASIRAKKAAGANYADEAKQYDPFSVISLNWDILLDKAIFRSLEHKDQGIDGDYKPVGVIDYCCYISSINQHERRIRPGLWALGARGYNVKLLKIHGSMNWLQCSNCQRLFVGFGGKINIPNYINVQNCRHCEKCGIEAKLQGSLVMPTFLKDLSNFQVKLVWQNAAVELMEANKVVFVGYSLPAADFEFRQLLSRTVRKDATIEVFLFRGDNPASVQKYEDECERYRQFFGTRKVTTHPDGVEAMVKKLGKVPKT